MTNTPPIRTREEFEHQLSVLVESAARNGIDPRGGWRVRQSAVPPDYEALITEINSDS